MKLKFVPAEGEEGGELEPLIFDKHAATPSYAMIGFQAFLGLGGLIMGAHLFVMAAESMAGLFAMSPLILALLIAPLATELPEMSNSFLWLYRKKDRLAVANVTGAMVFQSTFPVALGLIGTEWVIAPSALTTMIFAVQAVGPSLPQILIGSRLRPWLLAAGAVFYIAIRCISMSTESRRLTDVPHPPTPLAGNHDGRPVRHRSEVIAKALSVLTCATFAARSSSDRFVMERTIKALKLKLT